jgi:nucleoside-diphosphate-sugar epimerase
MKVLITGVAGFIGFSLAQNLLKKKILKFMVLTILIIIIQ